MYKKAIKSLTPGVYENLRIVKALIKIFMILMFRRSYAQGGEDKILSNIAQRIKVKRTFVEFGFHPGEFNCMPFVLQGWRGLLIDADARNVATFRRLAKLIGGARNTRSETHFITKENARGLISSRFHDEGVGILSIDVDGVDYWLMEELIALFPDLICVEYNPSFQKRSITVPYDPKFDRHEKHPSGWYHGASLKALSRLATRNGYALVGVSDIGINAFFLRCDLLRDDIAQLDPDRSYKEGVLRNRASGIAAQAQWEKIKDLLYIEI